MTQLKTINAPPRLFWIAGIRPASLLVIGVVLFTLGSSMAARAQVPGLGISEAEAKEKAEGIKKEIIDSAKKQREEIETESDKEISHLHHETRSRISDAVEATKKRVAEFLDKGVS